MTLSVQVLQRLLAYAYTFNDPLSIHFSLVPVLQVPTIASLAYFSTSPRLCRDPTPRHPHPQLRLLLSYYYYQAAHYPVQYFYILLLVYVVIHHSPVPPTSPTTPSVADSVYVANLRLPG